MSINARYDPVTDKIIGCEKGSYLWHHENRHRKQAKDGVLDVCQMWTFYAIMFAVYALAFDLDLVARIMALIAIGMHLFLEIDAWMHGTIGYLKETHKEH